ncbi:hypothetical protein L7F22_039444 [Adiantum nelumboides]|nr:hypothetical protein [Adiantum nelumboides]
MSAPLSIAPDTATLYRQRGLNPPPFPPYKSKSAASIPIKELRGGHRPAPVTSGTIAEPLASFSSSATKGSCSVRSLGWSIDGRRLASSASDRSIRIWTPEVSIDARSTSELRGHTDGVEQITWHPLQPDQLASASGDKTVKFWDVRSSKETNTIRTPGTNINIAYHPQGTYIAIGDRDDTISLIDVRTGKSLGLIRSMGSAPDLDSLSAKWINGEREEINEFSWTPDGRMFVMGAGSGKVRVLDARSLDLHMADAPEKPESKPTPGPALHWPLEHTIAGHTATVFCIRMDPLGRYLATSSGDGTTALWTLDEFFNISVSGHHANTPRTISLSYEGEFMASSGEDKFICITATSPMNPTSVDSPLYKIPISSSLNAVAWHPSRYYLAYAGDESNGTIRIWGMS